MGTWMAHGIWEMEPPFWYKRGTDPLSIHQMPELLNFIQLAVPDEFRWSVIRLASLTMISLLTIFEMNFVEVWQSSHTHRFLTMQSGVPGSVLMNNSVFTMETQMKHLFFFLHITQHKICIGDIPHIIIRPENLFSSAWILIILGWIWSSTTNECSASFTSIQARPGCFFASLSFLCYSNSTIKVKLTMTLSRLMFFAQENLNLHLAVEDENKH